MNLLITISPLNSRVGPPVPENIFLNPPIAIFEIELTDGFKVMGTVTDDWLAILVFKGIFIPAKSDPERVIFIPIRLTVTPNLLGFLTPKSKVNSGSENKFAVLKLFIPETTTGFILKHEVNNNVTNAIRGNIFDIR